MSATPEQVADRLESLVNRAEPWSHAKACLRMHAAASLIRQLSADKARLREALVEARECVASWGGYASSYFQEKHDLEGDIARIDAALGDAP